MHTPVLADCWLSCTARWGLTSKKIAHPNKQGYGQRAYSRSCGATSRRGWWKTSITRCTGQLSYTCDACVEPVVVCCMRWLLSMPKYRSWQCQASQKQMRTQAGHPCEGEQRGHFVTEYNITMRSSSPYFIHIGIGWLSCHP